MLIQQTRLYVTTFILRVFSLGAITCLFAAVFFSQTTEAQDRFFESIEYKDSKATVGIELMSWGSGHVTATVTLRRENSEKVLASIQTHEVKLHGRTIALPTSGKSLSTQDSSLPFAVNGKRSDALARGGLPSRYLLISVPETAEHDRLVMIDLQTAEAEIENRKDFLPQEILVLKEGSDVDRTYSVKSVAAPERHKPRAGSSSVGGTLLSIADVDKNGKIATFGTGLVVHQMFFLMDKNFINLAQLQMPLALRNDHSYEIVDKTTGSVALRSLGIHHTPRHLPAFKVRDGRIEPALRFGGPINPLFIEVIGRQGTNGILALPYLPLETRNPQPVTNLFDSFLPEYRADLTIEQASSLPMSQISNRESVEEVRKAILVKSDVTAESQSLKRGLRLRQENGLKVLKSIAIQFPPALEAIKSIADSSEADATLRAMAKSTAHQIERETKLRPKSLKVYQELINDVLTSSQCVRAFVPVTGSASGI